MLNSAILDIAIGMVFVYFLLSLLCLTLAELIARVFAIRSATLYDAIRNLLADPKIGSALIAKFWQHPLIATLSRSDMRLGGIATGRHKPSYIPANLFALALLDVIGEQAQSGALHTPGEVKSALKILGDNRLEKLLLALVGADGDMQQIQMDLAKWYDQYMERVSGWYKRKAQAINLVLALALAGLLNADSLAIFNALSGNPQLRAAAVDVATQYMTSQPAVALTTAQPVTGTQAAINLVEPVTQLLSLEDTLAKLNLPLTWAPADDKVPRDLEGWGWKIVGLLMTAFLVSLGAPFWFDLLNRFVSLRSTGSAPGKAADDSSNAGTADETPLRSDETKPDEEQPRPDIALDVLADRAVQIAGDYQASGRLKSRAEEEQAAEAFLDSELRIRGWKVTGAQKLGALAAAFEQRRTAGDTSGQSARMP